MGRSYSNLRQIDFIIKLLSFVKENNEPLNSRPSTGRDFLVLKLFLGEFEYLPAQTVKLLSENRQGPKLEAIVLKGVWYGIYGIPIARNAGSSQ